MAQIFDVITLLETGLSDKNKSTDCSIVGYQPPFKRDRADNSGYGTVMAHVSSNSACKRAEDLECATIKEMWLEISATNDKFLHASAIQNRVQHYHRYFAGPTRKDL